MLRSNLHRSRAACQQRLVCWRLLLQSVHQAGIMLGVAEADNMWCAWCLLLQAYGAGLYVVSRITHLSMLHQGTQVLHASRVLLAL